MKILINNTEYRFTNDCEITEQAGATSVMTINIKLDDKRIPQPFDTVEVIVDDKINSNNLIVRSGVKNNVTTDYNTLELAKTPITTYAQIASLTYADLTPTTYAGLILGYYAESGTYEKAFNISNITDVDSSVISWTGSATLVQTKVDNGSWITVNSGDAISGLPGSYLSVRFELDRDSLFSSPVISDANYSIEQEGSTLFYGTVGVPESPTYSTGFETDIYSISLQSANALLRRRLVSEAYEEMTTPEIVQAIFDKYISSEGITLGAISDIDFTYTVYVAQRKYVADVLDELVAPVGATWHISPEKKFYFLTKDDFTTVDAPTHLNSIKKETSGIDVRTVQIIAGARSRTSLQSESFVLIDSQTQLITGFPLVEAPTVYINGVAAEVGVSGIESDNDTKTFLWSTDSQTISINSSATVTPVTGDTILVEYIGSFEIEIEDQNYTKIAEIAALTGTSGRIEKVETDSTIETYADGNALAEGLLDMYGESEETITCITNSLAYTEPLTIWTFNLPEIHVEGDYIITKRAMSQLDIDIPKVEVTLQNKSYYLKYGEVYNDYDKNIRRLSVNASSVIIKTDTNDENLALDESWEQAGLVFFPTVSEFSDPTALFYPMELQA